MELNRKIEEYYKNIQSMSDTSYEAYIVALLIYEKEGTDFKTLNNEQIEVYKGVYDEFLSNDYFDLMNDNFEDVINDHKEMYKENSENKSINIKNKKSKEQER